MWYVIAAGVGLAVGVGFLIWGLIERSKRAKAERELYDAQERVNWWKTAYESAKKTIDSTRDKLDRAQKSLDDLRSNSAVLLARLRECRDKQTIEAWIDSEFGEYEL